MTLRKSGTELKYTGFFALILSWHELAVNTLWWGGEKELTYLYKSPAARLVRTVFPRSITRLSIRALIGSSSVRASFGVDVVLDAVCLVDSSARKSI